MTNKIVKLAAILLAILPIGIGNVSYATVIIEVDISDPSAVIIRPTAAFAESTFLNLDTSFN